MSFPERRVGLVLWLWIGGCADGAAPPVADGLCPAPEVRSATILNQVFPRVGTSLDLASLMVAADLDGDLQSEIIMVDPAGDRVHVIQFARTDQGATTTEDISHVVGRYPLGVAVGDVDADGCADIVTANFADDDVSVLSCPASMGAARHRRIAVGAGPRAVEVVDIDGDAIPEIVVAGALDGSLTAVSLIGADVIVWEPLCGSPGTTAIAARVRDERADLWLLNTELDLWTAVTPTQERGFRAGGSSGTASSPVQDAVVDGETGTPGGLAIRGLFGDLVVHPVSPSGELGDASSRTGVSASLSILAREPDADGSRQLLSLTTRHGLVAFGVDGALQQMSAYPASEAGRLYHLLLLDLASEVGNERVVARVSDSGEIALLGNHVATDDFGSSEATATAIGQSSVQSVADLNADGINDVLIFDTSVGLGGVLLGGSLSAEALPLPAEVAEKSGHLVVGSFDDDENIDLAFISYDLDAIVTLKGSGDGRFTVAAQTAIPEKAFYLAAGDVSGDGLDDLVLTASWPVADRRVAYLAAGEMVFDPKPVALPGAGGEPFIRDVDGIGRLDLVFAPGLPVPQLEVLIATGPDGFVARESLKLGQRGGGPEIVDVDRDGILDLIACGSPSFDPTYEGPDGLLVFRGGEDRVFGPVTAIGVGGAEIPGAPAVESVTRFRCGGLYVLSAPEATTVMTHGVIEYASGERYAAALTFLGGSAAEGPAKYVRGELLPGLAAEEAMHGDFTGDAVMDLLGRDATDAPVLVKGRRASAYAPFGTPGRAPMGAKPP